MRPTWLDALVDTEVRDVHEVEVQFANEPPLTTGDVVFETARGWLQLISVHPDRHARTMRAASDVKLVGDWSDRSGLALQTLRALDAPFRVTRVDYVQRGEVTSGSETIGAWLVGVDGKPSLSIVFDPEDVQVGPPEKLWQYLASITGHEPKLTIYGGK